MAEFQAGEVVVPVVPDATGFVKQLRKDLVPEAQKLGQDIGRQITLGIRESLSGVYEPLQEQSRKQQPKQRQEGEQLGGAFARAFRARLEAAFKSLPKVELDADATPAQTKVAELRARMAELSGKTVGIDVDAATALAEVQAIQRELAALDGDDVTIDVRTDIGAAMAELAAIEGALSHLDGRTVQARVDVDISGAMAAIGTLSAALAGLAAIPVGASIAAGLGAIAGPLAAAGAGIAGLAAVAAPSLERINEALKEQEKAAHQAAGGLGAAAQATRNLAIEAAQAQIAQLQAANAADQLRSAQDRVKDAVAGVADAKQRLKQAVQAAAQAQTSAASRVASAERSLASAQQAALKAQEALNRARQQAIKTLADISRSLRGNALDQREAALDLREAEAELNRLRAKGASAEEIERAEIAYERAQLRVEELKAQEQELQEQQAKGVDGQDAVVAAKERLEDANRRVLDQEKALADAYAASGKAGEDAARRVADARKEVERAERRVDDAKRALEQVKRQQKIAKLQDKIRQEQAKEQAKRQAQAQARAAAAAAKATQKQAELSPAEALAAKEIKKFQDAYQRFQQDLAPSVLPVITGGLQIVQSLFKPLAPLIQGTAKALTGLEKSAAKALGGPFWKDFFAQLSKEAPGAITGLGRAFGNIIEGITGIIRAFLPFSGTVTGGIEGATKAFAEWGKSLKDSQGFKDFIAYVQANGPKIWQVIQNIATVVLNLLSGLAGPGSGALDVVVKITDWLAGLSPDTLQAFALAALGVVAAFKGWKIITTAVDGVAKAIQTAQTIWKGLSTAAGLAANGVKLAASGITTAVKGIGSVGKGAGAAGRAVWTGIQTAASKAASVAKTSGQAIASALRTAGSATAKGAQAAWTGIQAAAGKAGAAARTAGTAIATAGRTALTAAGNLAKVAAGYASVASQALLARTRTLLAAAAQGVIRAATIAWTAAQRVLNAVMRANPIGLIITAIGLLVGALIYAWNNSETFRNVVLTVWEAIKTGIQIAWENVIKPVLEALWTFITDTLAPIFKWLWNNIIKPAWDGISSVITAAWNNVIKPALNALWKFVTETLAPKVLWFHNTIVKPVFDKVGEVIKFTWEKIIKPALNAIWTFITETLAPKILWFHNTIVKPVFDKVGEVIKFAWEKIIKPAFEALWKFITETIPEGFKSGVSKIESFWNKVRDVAKKPVQFIIETVYNNGIVKLWNAVADALKLERLPTISFAAARGGIYPGYTPGRDIGLAAVSGGEAIMRPEWTRAVGADYVHGANAAARRGGVGGVRRFLGGFADGGIIGDLLAKGVRAGAEAFLKPLLAAAETAIGDSPYGKLILGVPKKLITGVIDFLAKRDAETGALSGGKAIAYAREQIGKPYKWGATGPDAFDCSGLTMRAYQAAGRSDIPRTSQQQMAWVQRIAKPVPGALGFPNPGHVWLYSSPSTIIEAPQTGKTVREVAARAAEVIGVPPPPQKFDSGGFLVPGTSLVHNGTGRPEPVLTDRQWQTLTAQAGRGDGPLISIEEFHATPQQTPQQIARELDWLAKSRG